jgi:Fanconi anemia group M protein
MGVKLNLERLENADYVVSSRVAIEYKTKEDFVNSIVDGRLLSQLRELKENYERPVMIVEGIEDIYSIRKVHPNAIHGMLSTIAVSYGIPIIYTKTHNESASIIRSIAQREQGESSHDFSLHGSKKPMTIKEQQEYIVSAFPSVGPGLAKELLKKFGTIEKILVADEKQLRKVDKVGPKIAKSIREIVEKEY